MTQRMSTAYVVRLSTGRDTVPLRRIYKNARQCIYLQVQQTGVSCTVDLVPRRRKQAPAGTVIGYVRVSTEDQANSGLGLDAQRSKLADEVARRGWDLVDVFADEGLSAKTITARPGLLKALEAVETGKAQTLMASKLDRLSRSVHDFTGLVDRSKRLGWTMVVLDLGVDTSTPSGAMMANVLASFAQFERELIGQRTSDALQEKRRGGAVLGRPDRSPDYVVATIVQLRAEERTLAEIADTLMDRGIPTAQGADVWRPSSVASVLNRHDARRAISRITDPACWSWPVSEDLDLTDPWAAVERWQNDRCALCGITERLERDHDHDTGLRRGLICKSCNNHEGACGDRSCSCAKYRLRNPASMLGVEVRHGGWFETDPPRSTPEETAARIEKIRTRRLVL